MAFKWGRSEFVDVAVTAALLIVVDAVAAAKVFVDSTL